MIIDVHGHYTTAPKALEVWRNRQIAGIAYRAAMPKASDLVIGDAGDAQASCPRIVASLLHWTAPARSANRFEFRCDFVIGGGGPS